MAAPNSVPASAFKHPVHFLAIGLGSGAAKRAPGTWGTVMAVLLYLPMTFLPLWAYGVMLLATTVLGIYLCDKTSRDWGVHDHSGIVWDEFVGYWITMFALPPTLFNIVVGFALFRCFDIAKPWPISWVDKHVHGGWGIMLDDILAGVFACVLLWAIHIGLQ